MISFVGPSIGDVSAAPPIERFRILWVTIQAIPVSAIPVRAILVRAILVNANPARAILGRGNKAAKATDRIIQTYNQVRTPTSVGV